MLIKMWSGNSAPLGTLKFSLIPRPQGSGETQYKCLLNVEAMQHLHGIINYVIASSELNFINDEFSLGVNNNLRKNLQ